MTITGITRINTGRSVARVVSLFRGKCKCKHTRRFESCQSRMNAVPLVLIVDKNPTRDFDLSVPPSIVDNSKRPHISCLRRPLWCDSTAALIDGSRYRTALLNYALAAISADEVSASYKVSLNPGVVAFSGSSRFRFTSAISVFAEAPTGWKTDFFYVFLCFFTSDATVCEWRHSW